MHALKAAARSRFVLGIDRDRAALGVARRAGRERGIGNAAFLAADLEQGLPIRGGTFDTVICLDLLEHVVERDRLLGEIRRVLRPGGALLLAVPNRATSWKRRLARAGLFAYSDPDHKIEYTLPELTARARPERLSHRADAHGRLRHAADRRDQRRGQRVARALPAHHGGAPAAGAPLSGRERGLLRGLRGGMKILFATEYYRPFTPGGTSWSLELLARELGRRGHGVAIVTPSYGAPRREIVDGVTVFRFPFWRRLPPGRISRRCATT